MSRALYSNVPQSSAQILPDEEEDDGKPIQIEVDPEPLDDATPAEDDPVDTSAAAAPAGDTDDDIPEPLRGKTPKQLAKMYTEAQKVIGRQGKEVGEVRQLADRLIQAQLADKTRRDAAPAPKPKPDATSVDDDTEFFAKPRDAVSRAISDHPDMKSLKEAAAAAVARERMAVARANEAQFQKEFPDAGDTLKDEAFRTWIESSRIRKALMVRANNQYDLEAAQEVFGQWRDLKAARTPTKPAPSAQRTPAQKKAVGVATVPSGNAGAGRSTPTGKLYRRADIMRLMEEDPDRYEALSEEIQRAYQEKRVV